VTAGPGFHGQVVAIDWSGAKDRPAQRQGICVATTRDGSTVEASAGRTRLETVELVERLAAPVVVGFDFSFGLPLWFAREHGCTTIDDVWALAERDGEAWLGPPPTPPFWNTRRDVPIAKRFRRCEEALPPAKSVFQLVGNGQVGAGSVRGMPLLARLRGAGFAVWPFDPPGERTAVEIYPSRLAPLALPPFDAGNHTSPHERDAVGSAYVMWQHRASFAKLEAATDPITRIEGDVWMPSSSP
jgi:hypothetical protein